MPKHLLFLFGFLVIFSCKKKEKLEKYPTIDYLKVKLKLDTLNKSYRESGIFPTVISTAFNGKKSVTFFGTSHVRDTTHPQFKLLIKSFKEQNPEIAFNEGGQVNDTVKYLSVGKAIETDGETGLLKHLCNQANIKLINGDMDTKAEFAGLLATFPKEEVLLYLACERFLNPYRQGFLGKIPIEEAYEKDFLKYLEKYDFKLNAHEKSINYLRTIYKKYLGKTLELITLIEVHDYYLNNTGRFGDIGRKSKDIRDQALLTKIDKALETHNRVFVVFGTSHWVAVQPGLQYIIDKY
jgi:hypothetical protein